MARYDFKDIQPSTTDLPIELLSSEAMLIVENDSKYIEQLVSGYQTLTVDGRGLVGYKVDSNEINGGDGQFYLGANMPARVITVEYKLMAKSSSDLISRLNALSDTLLKKQFTFSFNDEPGFFYKGTVTSFEPPEKGSLSGKGSFEITCSDPYKYGIQQVVQFLTTSSGTATAQFQSKDYILDRIEFTTNASTAKFGIENTVGQSFMLDGSFSGGDKLIVDMQKPLVTLNGTDHTSWIYYVSSVEDFQITQKMKFINIPAGNVQKFFYRERRV